MITVDPRAASWVLSARAPVSRASSPVFGSVALRSSPEISLRAPVMSCITDDSALAGLLKLMTAGAPTLVPVSASDKPGAIPSILLDELVRAILQSKTRYALLSLGDPLGDGTLIVCGDDGFLNIDDAT